MQLAAAAASCAFKKNLQRWLASNGNHSRMVCASTKCYTCDVKLPFLPLSPVSSHSDGLFGMWNTGVLRGGTRLALHQVVERVTMVGSASARTVHLHARHAMLNNCARTCAPQRKHSSPTYNSMRNTVEPPLHRSCNSTQNTSTPSACMLRSQNRAITVTI